MKIKTTVFYSKLHLSSVFKMRSQSQNLNHLIWQLLAFALRFPGLPRVRVERNKTKQRTWTLTQKKGEKSSANNCEMKQIKKYSIKSFFRSTSLASDSPSLSLHIAREHPAYVCVYARTMPAKRDNSGKYSHKAAFVHFCREAFYFVEIRNRILSRILRVGDNELRY